MGELYNARTKALIGKMVKYKTGNNSYMIVEIAGDIKLQLIKDGKLCSTYPIDKPITWMIDNGKLILINETHLLLSEGNLVDGEIYVAIFDTMQVIFRFSRGETQHPYVHIQHKRLHPSGWLLQSKNPSVRRYRMPTDFEVSTFIASTAANKYVEGTPFVINNSYSIF